MVLTGRFTRPSQKSWQWSAGFVAALIPLIIYLSTLDDGLRMEELQGGDLITHQYAQVQGRPSNAPGYPIYTMLGWLWFRLGRLILGSFFSPLQILSLYSTLWAIAALVVFYLLALRVTKGNWVVSALVTLFYSVTYFFWYYSVSTEQYTSAVFQSLLIFLLALRWQSTRQDHLLLWLAFIQGTCLANLVTVLLVTPPLVWFVLSQDRSLLRRPRFLAKLCVAGLLPTLSYTFIYIRGAQHTEWRGQGEWPSALAWFLDFISTGQGRGEMTLSFFPLNFSYLRLTLAEITWPVLAVGVLGLVLLERRQALLTCSTILLYLFFSYVDRFGNWYQVIMPIYPLLLIGVAHFATLVVSHFPSEKQRLVKSVLALVLVTLFGERFITNLPRADLSNRPDDDALCPGLVLVTDVKQIDPEADVAVVVSYEEFLSLQYLQTIFSCGHNVDPVAPANAQNTDVFAVTRAAAPLYFQLIDMKEEQAREETLLTFEPNPLPSSTSQFAVGPLHGILERVERRYYDPQCGGDKLVVIVNWKTTEPVPSSLAISARPMWQGELLRHNDDLVQDDKPLLRSVSAEPPEPKNNWWESYVLNLADEQQCDSIQFLLYQNQDGVSENNISEVIVPVISSTPIAVSCQSNR